MGGEKVLDGCQPCLSIYLGHIWKTHLLYGNGTKTLTLPADITHKATHSELPAPSSLLSEEMSYVQLLSNEPQLEARQSAVCPK